MHRSTLKVIAATASEALYVLDGLLYHQSDVTICRHHTDGGGDSDHVFALCALLGFQFAPRIPDFKPTALCLWQGVRLPDARTADRRPRQRRAHPRPSGGNPPGPAASIRTGTVTASLIMRQLSFYPRQNGVAGALL